MTLVVSLVAAVLLVLGSGLIFIALVKLDRQEDMGRVSEGHWSRREFPG